MCLGWGIVLGMETGLHDSKWCLYLGAILGLHLCHWEWSEAQTSLNGDTWPWNRKACRSLALSEELRCGGPSPEVLTGDGCLVRHLVSVKVVGTSGSREGGMPIECNEPNLLAWVIKKKR